MKPHFFSIDLNRLLIVPGNREATITFMADHFIALAKDALFQRGHFYVALSGGSTPQAVYQKLASQHRNSLDWSRISFFFSDERAVSPNDPNSNYFSAMHSGLQLLPIKKEHVYRMEAEKDLTEASLEYEHLILKRVPNREFDLILLGMGEDGHTASLFPHTQALKIENRDVVGNRVEQKNTNRMTFTFNLINRAKTICFYVIGKDKKAMVKTVLTPNFSHFDFPATLVGSQAHPALWILDQEAAQNLPS